MATSSFQIRSGVETSNYGIVTMFGTLPLLPEKQRYLTTAEK